MKKSRLIKLGKSIGFTVAFIGFVSSAIGIYSFIKQNPQERQIAEMTSKIDKLSKKIDYNSNKLDYKMAKIENSIDKIELADKEDNIKRQTVT